MSSRATARHCAVDAAERSNPSCSTARPAASTVCARWSWGPYCEFLSDGESELRYLIISAEVLSDPTRPYEDLQVLFNDSLLPRIVELLLDQLELPDGLASERLVVGISQVITTVSTRARQQLVGDGVRERAHGAVFVANLIDMLHGSITAPVGPATLAALELGVATSPSPR